ncbi:LacI family DNA-binding transcriptional regulator [Sporosarcina sp. 6E9]|uniref:LacI family DNA-binding transcriptional regulator n=1 Tax=Sporosarcina sp. 6E9 TaxID=2819235 RepID=UPI001B31333C|nr:LacI family DNA-binding transcriptional regulator [Sporosarcina sp. 6E9]
MKERVNAYDVAKRAGVSQSTVSRVLNNYSHVKKSTRERVLAAVDELGFTPDEIARSLANNKTRTIGLIVGNISNPFYAETAHIILREARDYDYDVIIVDTDSDESSFDRSIQTLIGKRVDGIIVASVRKDNKKISELFKLNFPIICYNRKVDDDRNTNFVVVDNKQGAKMAVNHLIQLNHQRIAYISGPCTYSTFNDRFLGYQSALKENGIDYDKRLVYQNELSFDKVFQFSLDLMRNQNRPTSFFASTDHIALAVMDAAAQNGLHIPYDISIIGFDNIDIASSPYIGLSTISQQKKKMASLVLKELIAIIDKKSDQLIQITLEPELLIRKSTGMNTQIRNNR